ncbi:MAG TPA: NTP transferase domain-containing protein [Gemmatimonadales bacterium]|nr:NTP transferase domain-containing protein [Gemmatimonadales bacterium]
MTTRPTLLFLAAGLGSRYGGNKQLEGVGPGGETLMDYSVHDAIRAGFGRIVFVTRTELEPEFNSTIIPRIAKRIPALVVTQRFDDLPTGIPPQQARRKPWGTGQAVLAARHVIEGPFGVLNADDFYGFPALERLAAFLAAGAGKEWAVVGYPLWATLSEAGAVNRALFEIGPGGTLTGLTEVREIVGQPDGSATGRAGGTTRTLAANDLVSMNLWGFTPALFDALERGFRAFLEGHPADTAEYFLPEAVADEISAGRATVRVLETDSAWCGLSHAADRPVVQEFLRRQIAAGHYPERLAW